MREIPSSTPSPVPSSTPSNWRWHNEELKGGRTVVFDMDGVLCNADGRQHFITNGNRDWKGFFEACGNDSLIEESSALLRLLAAEVNVVLLTGRPIEVQPATLDWLHRHE